MCEDAGAILYTVELALRDRHHAITCASNPRHIQLRSPAELWHKENLLNIGIRALPADWKYVAWIDADVEFSRPDWATECVQQLQHYHVLQMWSEAIDLIPDPAVPGNIWKAGSKVFNSFLFSWTQGRPLNGAFGGGSSDPGGSQHGHLWHSGYAWAARRSALADLGGLGEMGILGSGDRHMAAALIGEVRKTVHSKLNPSYLDYWLEWEERALRHVNRNIGYMPGLLLHHWHGRKIDRKYADRWKILIENQFDLRRDVKHDVQGVLAFNEKNWKLRNAVREYFRARNEDSVDQ
jgi:hypothetical protein